MDKIDRKLLNLMQEKFPLSATPWLDMADELGIGEQELFLRIRRLKADGIIRRIGGVMDSRKIGYHACLCAARLPEERLAAAAALINPHPGVTHNYQRDHEYNLWFTLTTRSEEELHAQIAEWERELDCKVLCLPALKLYKIRVAFAFEGEGRE
ncbi:MAG: AsnC family transcriptional regulator [Syntrophomonadaceae bacterium]|nr:AsnC family transcriptional regulator [Syntrophomonadaceae bacterium]